MAKDYNDESHINNQSGPYKDLFGWKFKQPVEEKVLAPYVKKENDEASIEVSASYYGQYSHQLSLETAFANEVDQIMRYRESSLSPECDNAIMDICNEAISGEDDSSPVKIITDDLTDFSESVRNIIHKEFALLLEKLEFKSEAYEIFRKFYVDGRLSYLKIIDPQNPKLGIVELRYIPAIAIKKVRQEKTIKAPSGIEMTTGYEEYFLYNRDLVMTKTSTTAIKLAADSVCFIHSGLVDEKNNVIYSYLQKALKPLNQLRILEDAVLIYTLARAPQRRVFYVDVGNLPKHKAEEYLKSVMNRFKNKMVYDAITGEIKDDTKTISMLEDFWLPRTQGGKATEIDTLDGGQLIGSVDILDVFRKKLYMSLNVPTSRITWEAPQGFALGRPSEITREEIKFSKFISRLRARFNHLFMDLLRTQLLLKQIITEADWDKMKEKISFDYISDSHFKELKEADLLKERLSMLELIEPFVGTYFSREYVKKKVLCLNEEDVALMDKQMSEEADAMQSQQDVMDAENEQQTQKDDAHDDDNWKEVPDPSKPVPKVAKKPQTKPKK
jgi:hypothetical protein